MCGVPYHAAEGYIGKLIRKGFKVAICEQMEDPRLAKKLVRREVTRVVTPGTAADSSLGSEENNFLAAAGAGRRLVWDSPHWIYPLGSFGLRNFRARARCGECRKSWSSCGRRNCYMARRRRCLRHSGAGRAAEFARPAKRGRHLPRMQPQPRAAGATCTETPLDDWIFAPDHAHAAAGKSFRRVVARRIWTGRDELPRLRPPGRFCITCARRSAVRSITWTASAGMSGRIAWCSTRSRCAIWS